MKYIVISFLLISCGAPEVQEVKHLDTVVIYDYLRGNDTLIIDISKKCQNKVIHEQMERMSKLERKLDKIKKKIERAKRNNGNQE